MNTEPDATNERLPEAADAAAVEPPAPLAATTTDEPVLITTPVPPVKRRRWGRWLVALLLLLLIGLGVWFGLTRREENQWVQAGQAALADEDWPVAEVAFTQALDTRPAFFRGQVAAASLGRGIAYYHQDDHAAALDDFTLAAANDETLAQPHGYMSLIHFMAGEYEASLADYAAFADESRSGRDLPDNILAQLHAGQATIHYEQENGAPALTSIDLALAHDEHLSPSQLAHLYAYRVILNYQAGQTDTVVADGELALEQPAILPKPLRALVRSYMALTLFEVGDTEEALAISEQAVGERTALSDEILFDLYTRRATVYLDEENFLLAAEDANAALIHVTELTPEQQLELHWLRGEAFFARGFWLFADDSAQAILDIDDSLGMPYAWQAYAAYREHDYETALTLAATALEKDETLAVAYYVQGAIHFWQLNEAKGLPLLETARSYAPDNPEILALLLFAYYVEGDSAAATETYTALTKLEEESAPRLWAEAVVALQENDYTTGFEKATAAINLDSTRAEYFLTWAESTVYQTSFYTHTIAAYDRALIIHPGFAPVVINRAWTRFDHYEMDGFLEAADWLISQYPNNSQGYIMHTAYAQNVRYDLDEALQWAEQGVAAAPDSAAALASRGFVRISLELYEEARGDFEAALALEPDYLNGLMGLAMLAVENEAYDEALAYLDQGLAIFPYWTGGYLQKASIYFWHLEQRTEALAAVQAIWDFDPQFTEAFKAMALFAAAEGDFAAAVASLQIALQVTPNDYTAHARLALIYLQQNDMGKARGEVNTALDLNPREIEAIRVLMIMAYGDEDWEEVIQRAEQIIAIYELAYEAFGYRGTAHSRLGDFATAEADLNQAISMEPTYVSAYLELAYVYELQDDYESAIATLELALEQTADLQIIAEVENRMAYLLSIPELVDGQRVFTSTAWGISLRYDDIWEQVPPDAEANIIFDLITETSTGDYAFITIYASTVPSGVTAQDVMDFLHEAYQEANPSYREVSRQNTTVDGYNAVLQVADTVRSDEQGGVYSLRIRHYVVVHGTNFFLIEYLVLPGNYDELLDEFDAFVDTIDLIP